MSRSRFVFLYQHRLFEFDQTTPLALGALFIGSEFLYYWQHRASHRIRWMWATHSVHHSTTRFNLTAAIRLGWTGSISGNFLFFLPLALLGFHPMMIVAMLGINLFYQFFTHTEFVPPLGPLEWVLERAPSSPRASRLQRRVPRPELRRHPSSCSTVLFGTFAEPPGAREALRYGLVGGKPSFNPVKTPALGEWVALMLRDARRRERRGRESFAPCSGLPACE